MTKEEKETLLEALKRIMMICRDYNENSCEGCPLVDDYGYCRFNSSYNKPIEWKLNVIDTWRAIL